MKKKVHQFAGGFVIPSLTVQYCTLDFVATLYKYFMHDD